MFAELITNTSLLQINGQGWPAAGSLSHSEPGEDELLRRAAECDEAALSRLYDCYEMRIYRYIYHRTGDLPLAEDLTAQVFLNMLEAVHNRSTWHTSFSGWLFRIAHNLIVDHYRRQTVQQVSIDDAPPLPSVHNNPVQAAEQGLIADRLRSAMLRLTDEQAQVVSLRFLEGYSLLEVASLMNKTEGAIKALQHRAVATLRILLEHEQLL